MAGFSELLLKLGRGEKLTDGDLASLRDEARAAEESVQVVKAWQSRLPPDPSFSTVRAQRGIFTIPPISGMFIQRVGAQSINDNTETAISFNARTGNTEYFENTSTASNIKIAKTGRTIGILGTVEWDNNATGRRAIHVNLYDESDVNLTGITLHSLAPPGTNDCTLPVSGCFYIDEDYPTAHHIKITVIQTSGGALNMNGARIGLFLFSGT